MASTGTLMCGVKDEDFSQDFYFILSTSFWLFKQSGVLQFCLSLILCAPFLFFWVCISSLVVSISFSVLLNLFQEGLGSDLIVKSINSCHAEFLFTNFGPPSQ